MKREIFKVEKDEIDDYTSKGPWKIKGETYKFVERFRTDGDGEWFAVIVQRESDNKYFEFNWGYGDTKDYYEPFWEEVIPKEEKKIKWGWNK